jgi:hypothetical protein
VTYSAADGEYVGLCAEFPSLSWLDEDPDEAFVGIRRVVREVVDDMHASGETLPEPIATRQYSGVFQVRVPPTVHRQLVLTAAEYNMSLNRLVTVILAGPAIPPGRLMAWLSAVYGQAEALVKRALPPPEPHHAAAPSKRRRGPTNDPPEKPSP